MKPFVADVHMHSIVSGHAFGTIRELAAEASARGLRLIGVTDHSPGIPGTAEEIYFRNFSDAPRTLYGVEMLYGSEINILPGGGLTMSERTLLTLDYAVAGIHGYCYQDEGIVKNTDAVIRCMEHRKVRFISHPDSNKFPLDYPALVQGAKAHGVALEVNNSMCHNYYYVQYGRIYNADKKRFRRFKFVFWSQNPSRSNHKHQK